MLGHASAAVTLDVYSDLFDSDLDAVSAALDQLIVQKASAEKSRPTSASEHARGSLRQRRAL